MSKLQELIMKHQMMVKLSRVDSFTDEELETTATFSYTGNKSFDSRLAQQPVVVGRTIKELMILHSQGIRWTYMNPYQDLQFIYKTLEGHMDEIENYLGKGGRSDIGQVGADEETRNHLCTMHENYSEFLKAMATMYASLVSKPKERTSLRLSGRNNTILGKSKNTGPVKIATASSLAKPKGTKSWKKS